MRTNLSAFRAAVSFGVALCSFTVLCHAQAPTPGMGPVADQETAMWENLKAGKYDMVSATMTPDFVYAGPEGIGGREPSIAGLKSCTINSFSLKHAETRVIGRDSVLVTYVATVDNDCGPAPNRVHTAGDVNCTSTWVKRNGKWLTLAHTEAPAMKMPASPTTSAQ